MEDHTKVDDLKDVKDVKEEEIKDNLITVIYDFTYSEKVRLKSFNQYYEEKKEEIIEIINKLSMMYLLSHTKLLESFLNRVCLQSTIPYIYKIELAKTLENYEILDTIIPLSFESNVPIPCLIDAIFTLMKSEKYIEESIGYFCQVINMQKIECEYRYKTILMIELKIKDKVAMKYYLKQILLAFIRYVENNIRYRILAGQYLLQHCKIDKDTFLEIQKYLHQFMIDDELDYNIRADVADVLLHLGDEETKVVARDIILCLGRQLGNVHTIFENNENVHHYSIQESTLKVLTYLHQFPIPKDVVRETTFEAIRKVLTDITKGDIKEKVIISLNRIEVDRAIYGTFGNTLKGILLLLWKFIRIHKYKDELIKRVIEELVDMAGKCSSGYAARLLNVLSGFDNVSIKISWKDQIAGNLMGRLNAYIRELEDEEFKEQIIAEMRLNTDNEITLRKHFLRFFREKLPLITADMYPEFKEYMEDQEFALYLRYAIAKYEGHNFL